MRLKESPEPPLLSVIIPTLNEGRSIGATLEAIARLRGCAVELIVVDGGSADETVRLARSFGARVIRSRRGRGLQMHSGARAARGKAIWFLHADTLVPADAASRIMETLAHDSEVVGGNFTVRFDGEKRAARFLTW